MTHNFDQFWDENDSEAKQPGVEKEQVAEWESRHGVTLPRVLKGALHRQNGGLVCYSSVRVLPLAEMKPVEDGFCKEASVSRKTVRDPKLLFTFAWGDDGEPRFLMNFNANGPTGEPSVHHYWHDPGEVDREAKTLAKFFGTLLAVAPTPAVDWSETDRLDAVLHREKIDLSLDYKGKTAYDEVVLGRLGKTLVLYTHGVAPRSETYTKTMVPEPLDKSAAEIEECRPSPAKTYGLSLEPRDSDGIVSVESERKAEGRWKNTTERGVPVYVTVESKSKDTLKALRETLFGKKAAKKSEERDDTQEEMIRRMEGLTPEQRMAAGAEMALQMFEKNKDLDDDDDLDDESAEMLETVENIQKTIADMKKKAEKTKQGQPPDPDVAAVAELMSKVMEQAEEMDEDEEDDEEERPRQRKK